MAAEPKRTAGADRVLPPEICTEILIRLPAKSILRCRSVCKSWYSLVSCPNFISNYSVRNLHKNGPRVLLQPYGLDYRAIPRARPFSSHDESFVESREHDDVPHAFLDSNTVSNVRIVGSCNGLICLCKYNLGDPEVEFLIWNPNIRKVVEIPSGSYCSSSLCFSYYGFGFDSKTGDYKVMCTRSSYCGKHMCEIFDSRKGAWRRIILPLVSSWEVGGRTPECYLDGTAHWSASTDQIVLSFDMSDEVFRKTRMPDCAEFVWSGDVDDDDDNSRIETRSVAFGGLIHVIVWKTLTKRECYAVDMYEECSVWAMKEYGVAESWTKLFNIDLLGAGLYEDIDPNKFSLWENGEVLMVHDQWEDMDLVDKQGLLLYNPESRKCRQLFSFDYGITDMCLYEESLVLM